MNKEQAKMLTTRDTGYVAEWWWQKEGEPRRFYTRTAVSAALRRRRAVAPVPVKKDPEPQRPAKVRPVSATCETCKTIFPIGPKGTIARFCSKTCRERSYQRPRPVSLEALKAAKGAVREGRLSQRG